MKQGKSAFRRYKVIDGLLRNNLRRYPTMEDIIEACWEKLDYRPSKETIQKDIACMKCPYPDGFDAPIEYIRAERGYVYTNAGYSLSGMAIRPEDRETINEAVEVIRAIGGTKISEKFGHAIERLFSTTLEEGQGDNRHPILQTMRPPQSRGFEHFDLFYNACREQQPVSFIHFSYKKRTFKPVIIHPFLIKEFENRWYVIGYSETHEEVRTFGLDRISEPLSLKSKYMRTDLDVVQDYLQQVYGVFPIPAATLETIEILVSELGTHYLQAYPLHETQVITKHSEGTSTISYRLIPSIELCRFFLSQGRHIEIMQPKWLKKFTQDLVK